MCKYAITFASILLAGFTNNGFAGDSKTSDGSDTTVHQEASTDVGPVLEKLDVDKDGYIGKKEAGDLEGLSGVFDSADENKDGMLNAAELSKFLTPSAK